MGFNSAFKGLNYKYIASFVFHSLMDSFTPARGPRCHSGLGAVLQIGRSLFRSQLVSLEFFIDVKSFRSHYGPGVDSASNRNEYQEYFPGRGG